MEIFVFRGNNNKIWAITNRRKSKNQEVYNTQFIGSEKQSIVAIMYEDGKEVNRVIIGDKYIQISGLNAMVDGGENWNDCYILQGNSVLPKCVVEGERNLTINEALESIFLTGRLEKLFKNKCINGFSKETEERIDSHEFREELCEKYNTKVVILNKDKPLELDFKNNEQLSQISEQCINQIVEMKKLISEFGKKVSTEGYQEVLEIIQEREKKAKEIAEELKSLAEEIGKTPEDILRGI